MRLLAIATVVLLAPLAFAQRNLPVRAGHFAHRRSAASPLNSFLTPFLADSFNLDDLSGGDPSQGPAGNPALLLQATRALGAPGGFPGSSRPGREPALSEPLLIELLGDHYVRVSSAAIDGEARPLAAMPGSVNGGKSQAPRLGNPPQKLSAQNSAANFVAAAPPSAFRPPSEIPAATLVFMDGHSEEVRDYTIANGFLYLRGDFYKDGYWNKQISLSSLNLPQTSQANARKNVDFHLPSSPNEVIARF